MWKDLLGALVAPAVEYVRGFGERAKIREQTKSEVAQAEARIEVARADAETRRLQTQTEADVNWDAEAQRQAQRSWKDELWTGVAALPILAAFIDPDRVRYAFLALEHVPEWYLAIIAASVAFAFGVRHVMERIRKGPAR